MMPLRAGGEGPKKILCLGAHADDIEIGCGGTILSLLEGSQDVHVHWVVFSSQGVRRDEAERAAQSFLGGVDSKVIKIEDFPDTRFPYHAEELKAYFNALKSEISPDLVLTHYRDDLHQDHRCLCELTWNAFRGNMILEYEIPKYDGDLGRPNFFVPVRDTIARQKVQFLLDCFESQREKHWFEEETFLALMRLRGMETGGDTRYAEAFHCRKAVFRGF